MSVIIPPHPTPPHPTPPHPTSNWWWKSSACVCRTARKMMRLPCLCVYRNMNVIIPPHPTPPVTDDERAVPVSAGQQERWWFCRACVYRNMNVIIPPHPTPPPPQSGSYLACGGKQNQSLVAVRTLKDLTAASDWFLLLQLIVFLLPQAIESYCRKWRLSHCDWDSFKVYWWSKTPASHSI